MMWISVSQSLNLGLQNINCMNIYRTRSAFHATADEKGSGCDVMEGYALRFLRIAKGIDDFLHTTRNMPGSLLGFQLSIDSGAAIGFGSHNIWFLGRFRFHCLGHCKKKSI